MVSTIFRLEVSNYTRIIGSVREVTCGGHTRKDIRKTKETKNTMARSLPQLFSPAIRTAAPHPLPNSMLVYVAVALVVHTAAEAAAATTEDEDESGDCGLLDSGVETGRVMMSGASAV